MHIDVNKITNTIVTDDFDNDYVLIYKDINNILDDINLHGEDRLLCKSIIDSLEKEAAVNIRNEKCVSIPHIGTIQKNWYRSKLISHYKDFKEARKTMSKDEYMRYTASVMDEEKRKHKEEEDRIKNLQRFKRRFLKRWTALTKDRGTVYANLWLYAIIKLDIVEFDPEIEEVYERFEY